MPSGYDEKGKYFTDVVSKVGVAATVQTVMQRIEGVIHVRVNERLKDEIDRNEPFLAMTSAQVFDQDGKLLYTAPFISVRRSQIVWIIPKDERASATGAR